MNFPRNSNEKHQRYVQVYEYFCTSLYLNESQTTSVCGQENSNGGKHLFSATNLVRSKLCHDLVGELTEDLSNLRLRMRNTYRSFQDRECPPWYKSFIVNDLAVQARIEFEAINREICNL